MKRARGVKKLTAEELAEAIVSALDRPAARGLRAAQPGPQIIFNTLLPSRVRRPVQRLLGHERHRRRLRCPRARRLRAAGGPESPTAKAGDEPIGGSPGGELAAVGAAA